MKRVIFFISLVFCSMNVTAQDSVAYRSVFSDTLTIWEGINVRQWIDAIRMISRANDTITIDGQKYHILRDDGGYAGTCPYSVYDEYYVRESESRDKLYFRFYVSSHLADSITSEMLVMDLSLNVGDTLDTKSWDKCPYLGDRPTPKITVDSIFYLDGRKIMRTTCIAYHNHPYYSVISDTLFFIEGVGPSMGIGFPLHAKGALYCAEGILWESGISIRCHFADSILDFHYTNYYSMDMDWWGDVCYFYEPGGNITGTDSQSVNIYPNPAQNTITINGTIPPQSSYRIVSSDGKTVRSGTLSDSSNSINVSNLKKGLYLISIESSHNKTIKKFVKL